MRYVTVHRVYESFELLSHVLFVLGRATTKYKMACWDEFGFLDKLEKQLSESRKQPDGTGKPVMSPALNLRIC